MKTKKKGTSNDNSGNSTSPKLNDGVTKLPHPIIRYVGGIKMVDPKGLKIHPSVENIYVPRKDEEEAAFDATISNGVMQALLIIILLGEQYVIAGKRRLLASLRTGLTEIPVQVIEVDEADIPAVAVLSNTYRKKTEVEIYREGKILMAFYQVKQGQRTDLMENPTDGETKHRDKHIAELIGISPSHLYRNQIVGDKDLELLTLVDTQEDVTLSEVFKGCSVDKPNHEKLGEEVPLDEINVCPYCGNIPKRIDRDAEGNLTFKIE